MMMKDDSCCHLKLSFSCFGLTGGIDFSYTKEKGKDKEMKKILTICALVTVILSVAGCGQIYDREPVSIGYDNNELKLSPCACILVYKA